EVRAQIVRDFPLVPELDDFTTCQPATGDRVRQPGPRVNSVLNPACDNFKHLSGCCEIEQDNYEAGNYESDASQSASQSSWRLPQVLMSFHSLPMRRSTCTNETPPGRKAAVTSAQIAAHPE